MNEIKDIYKKHFRPVPHQRYVDFNHGVDKNPTIALKRKRG